MNGRILSTVFLATTGLVVVAAAPAHADCPERIDLLKQFVDSNQVDQISKDELDQLTLQAVESEEACERTVAELEKRLNVEVREDEVVRLTGDTTSGGRSGAGSQTDQSGQETAASDQQQATGAQTAAAGDHDQTIGGGLDMPRDQIDTKYGPLAWMTFGEVIGAQVITPEGDPIGEIIALVRERPLGDFLAVLDDGGGEGVVVPINKFEMVEGDQIGMSGDRDELDGMPKYDAERYEDVSG